MRRLVGRYDRMVVRTRRSQRLLLADVRKARRASAARISVPQQTIYQPAAGTVAPATLAPPTPTTSASPVK